VDLKLKVLKSVWLELEDQKKPLRLHLGGQAQIEDG
jgi:hypothetical protein